MMPLFSNFAPDEEEQRASLEDPPFEEAAPPLRLRNLAARFSFGGGSIKPNRPVSN